MNTKFPHVLLVSIIALLIAACAPAGSGSSVPIADPVQPPKSETVALVPVTGEQAVEAVQRDAQGSRLWSGEILLSDSDAPDLALNITISAGQDEQNVCHSEDSQPRRHGGCLE